jgi:hypothetical protein
MAELKTRPTGASVSAFLKSIPADRRADCRAIARIMRRATGARPRMWGPSIVGFGSMRYGHTTGRNYQWFVAGFSPRKGSLTLYLMSGLKPHAALLRKLGKHRTGAGCLYIKRLTDVDLAVLTTVVHAAVALTPASRD